MALIRLDVDDDGVAFVVLDDPDRRNAISLPLNDELVRAFDELEAAGARAVVVTGAGSAFCAGADLGSLGAARDAAAFSSLYAGFLRVAASPLPTIAAVNGPAVGAGMNLALGCDVILAGRSARFDPRFLQIGLHPGGGHLWRLRRRAGDQAVAAMVLFGDALDGQAAAAAGVAWRCVDDDDLLPEARRLARRAARVPRELLARAQESVAALPGVETADDAVALEITPQVWSAEQGWFGS